MMPAVLLSYAGFAALCLAMEKHHGELLRRKPSRGQADWAMGMVQWSAGLMASAVLLVWLLPYQPRLALGVAAASVLVSPFAALGWL
jgi:hypothetical protein